MSRLLCCCLLFLASPAAAELIVLDGGYYPRVNLNEERDVILRGDATVGWLNNVGGVATIEDAQLLDLEDGERHRIGYGGTLIVKGAVSSDIQRLILTHNQDQVSTLVIEAIHARGYPGHYIEAILADGQFARFSTVLHNLYTGCKVEIVVRDDLLTDPTGDGLFLLEDLNTIRNNFGAQAGREQGDADGDGLVGLSDLNIARNQFGNDPFFHSRDQELRGVVLSPQSNPVPEPSTIALGLLMLLTAASFRTACK